MPVIKANVPPAAGLTPFSLADIEQQAQAILEQARTKAAQIIATAQKTGHELHRRSHAEGLTAGYRDGHAKGVAEGQKSGHDEAILQTQEQLAQAIATLNNATSEFDGRRREFEAALETDVVQLSIRIAESISKRMGRLDASVLTANISQCLRLVTEPHQLRIAIHPTQRAVLDDAMPRLKLEFATLQSLEIQEDQTVAPGGCRLFTRQGLIDADLQSQINRISEELLPQTTAATAP